MTKRERELFLELLILRSRYSDDELKAVGRMAGQQHLGADFDSILRILSKFDQRLQPIQPSRRMVPQSPRAMRSQFLSRLNDKKKMSMARLNLIASMLEVGQDIKEREGIVRAISQKLSHFDESQIEEFIANLSERSADSSYLKLANFIIRED
ncbi:hypothetical protein [Mesorhizobium sp. LjRoot246]|uniref:hypothetical protein n=1 Tax=Mesorhizobium sp. LjRoot246 TaxID=3342294 RepID=UPI003ECFD50F